jgi:nitrite reductase/ring-hydroxylating ferredoxin subunit
VAWHAACKADDIKIGEAQPVELEGKRIAIYNVEGEFFATDDTCPHEEASLAEGFLEDHLIECPKHGSQFDLRSGHVLSLPAVFPVKTYAVRSSGDQIEIDI